jgi:23S rRNA pseudouridine2604 synthase
LFNLIEDSSSEDQKTQKTQAKKKPATTAKKPVMNGPKQSEKTAGKPAGRQRFTQPGRKKKGR